MFRLTFDRYIARHLKTTFLYIYIKKYLIFTEIIKESNISNNSAFSYPNEGGKFHGHKAIHKLSIKAY